MKNIISIKTNIGGSVQTDIVTVDGVSNMQIHKKGLHDSKVLYAIQKKNFYQSFKGVWVISFTDDFKILEASTFDLLIDAAQVHIFSRDNTTDYSGFC